MAAKLRTILCAIVTVSSLQGCATFDPYGGYFGPDSDTFRGTPTLANAFDYGLRLQEFYFTSISELAATESAARIGLTGVVTATSFLGIRGGSEDLVTGLGLGGAGLYVLGNSISIAELQRIYATAADAIACVIDAYSPVRSAVENEPDFQRSLAVLISRTGQLDAALAGRSGDTSLPVVAARQTLSASIVAIGRGRRALHIMQTSAYHLFNSVQRVRSHVAQAIRGEIDDLEAFGNALASGIPTPFGTFQASVPEGISRRQPAEGQYNPGLRIWSCKNSMIKWLH